MADIYTSKAISPQYISSFRASQAQYDDKSKELQQMAMKEKQEADEIYSLSVNNAAKMNMNELFTQYSADPKVLSEELKKLGSKISDEMPNDEMKVSFLSNYNLSSQSLVNKAQANFDKQQEINRKQAIKDSITNNINSMKLALSNGLSGSGSIDDLVNFQEAYKKNRNLVGSKNKKAQSTFTDAEKLAFDNDTNKVMVETFKETLNSMTDADKQDLIERLNNDDVVLLNVEAPEQKTSILADSINKYKSEDLEKQIKDIVSKIDIKSVVADAAQSVVNENLEDTDAIQQAIAGKIQEPINNALVEVKEKNKEKKKEEVKQPKSVQKKINLKDVVDETTYNDIKKVAKETELKLKKKAIQEWNINKQYSQIQLQQEPNEQNYKTWEYYHHDASDDKKQEMQKLANYVPNEDAETNFTGVTDAEYALSKLSNMPLDTEADRVKMLDNITDFILGLNKANERGDISSDDVKKQANLAYNMYNDRAFQEQVQAIFGQPSTFQKIATAIMGGSRDRKVIESIGLETTQNTIQALLNNDPETALKIYKEGTQKAIRMRYPEIPFNTMKEGDIFWYEPTGKAYKFLGYGIDDILVEVDPNTGVRK